METTQREGGAAEAVLADAGYAMVVTAGDGRIAAFNHAAERLSGYRAADLIGARNFTLLLNPATLLDHAMALSAGQPQPVEPGFAVIAQRVARGELFEREWSLVRGDGGNVPILLTVSRIERDGHPAYLAILVDVSARKQEFQRLRRNDLCMRATLENTPNVAVQWYDMDGRVLFWNAASEHFYGWSASDVKGRSVAGLTHDTDQFEGFLESLRRIARDGGHAGPLEVTLRRFDGGEIVVVSTLFAIPGEDVAPYFVRMDIDLTQRKQAERELASSQQKLLERNESLSLVNQLSSRLHGAHEVGEVVRTVEETLAAYRATATFAFYLYDRHQGKLQLVAGHNLGADVKAAGEFLSLEESLTGRALASGHLLISEDVEQDRRVDQHLRNKLGEQSLSVGVAIPLQHVGKPLGSIGLLYQRRPELGEVELETFEAIGKTVSMALANAHHLDHLQYQALHDALTGLPNRNALHQRFAGLAAAAKARGHGLALMLLDLNHFKEINDTLGHHVGDVLLCSIGRRLQMLSGAYDALLCRLGGDEFAIVAGDDRATPRELADILLASLRHPFEIDAMRLSVGGSIGVAVYPQDGSASNELLRSADVAMYEAKRQGGGIRLYERALDRHTPERLALMAEIDQAIANGQLALHYQPKLAASGEVLGFEALVRWQHPRYGVVMPGAFVPLVEVSETIHPLTREVLRQALGEQRRWRDGGKDYTVAVNLSARNLLDERCLLDLQALLIEFGSDPARVELEITESALMQDPEGAATLLDRMAALGVRLSIDDFGTGHSSLAYLRRLPIQTLKIDQVFIRNLATSEHDRIIVRSTIQLAHNLGLQVTAEGVENEETATLLREMGCDQMQGYHFCRPQPWNEILGWLSRRPAA